MQRDLCGLAPVFSQDIKEGDYGHITYRSNRGNVRFKGVCEVIQHNKTTLLLKLYQPDVDETEVYVPKFWVEAKDVYHGKHSFEWWGKQLRECTS